MKLWYYPRIYKLPPKDKLPETLQSIEIPDAEGKKRLCEHNQIISYEYAQHLERILGIRNTEDTEKRVNAATVDSKGVDSPQSGGTGENEASESKFF